MILNLASFKKTTLSRDLLSCATQRLTAITGAVLIYGSSSSFLIVHVDVLAAIALLEKRSNVIAVMRGGDI